MRRDYLCPYWELFQLRRGIMDKYRIAIMSAAGLMFFVWNIFAEYGPLWGIISLYVAVGLIIWMLIWRARQP